MRGWAKNLDRRQPVRCTASRIEAEYYDEDGALSVTVDLDGGAEMRKTGQARPRLLRIQLSRALLRAIVEELNKPQPTSQVVSGSARLALEAFRRRSKGGAR